MTYGKSPLIVLLLVLSVTSFSSATAADGAQLAEVVEQLANPSLDNTAAYDVAGLEIEHHGFALVLDSGTMYLIEPVVLDSGAQYVGGYFQGRAHFRFVPPVQVERDQVRRFFKTDSLNRECTNTELLFSRDMYSVVMEAGKKKSPDITPELAESFSESNGVLTEGGSREFVFSAVKAVSQPAGESFLLVNTELYETGRVIYRFDPYDREEVKLYRYSFERGYGQRMELVSSYSIYIDSSYRTINGFSKRQIDTRQYAITAVVDNEGFCACTATLEGVILKPVQMAAMNLRPEMEVDSILDASGSHVRFIRPANEDNPDPGLYLFLADRLEAGDSLALTLFYGGNIADVGGGELSVHAGADWYPRYRYFDRATFDLTLRTPRDLACTATGKQVERKVEKQKYVTQWRQDYPVADVTFAIGRLEEYVASAEDLPPIHLYYEPTAMTAQATDTAYVPPGEEDVFNSLKLFTHYFGTCVFPQLVAVEAPSQDAGVYASFLALGMQTFVADLGWGHDRLTRSTGVAHQWWGSAVGYETYHDEWLSKGIALYSALMYLQAAGGNDLFIDRLSAYRDEIFASHTYLFSTEEESGPVILGNRTAGYLTPEDAELIVYKKGAYIIHMLRNLLLDTKNMNEDRFLTMMRDWYQTYKGKPASTYEFQRMVEKYTGVDMSWFFKQFVYEQQLPTYEFSYTTERDSSGNAVITCHVVESGVPDDWMMYVPVEIEFMSGSKAYLRLFIEQPISDITLPPVAGNIKAIRFNPFNSVLAKVKR